MKEIGRETRVRMIANILTGCAVVLFAVVAYRINDVMSGLGHMVSILSPLILGFFLALMLRPLMHAVERLLSKIPFKGAKARILSINRVLSLLIVYTLLAAVVIGFIAIVVPQFVISAESLMTMITRFISSHRADIEWFLREFNITDITGQSTSNVLLQWEDIVRTAMDYVGRGLLSLVNMSYSIWGVSVNFFMSVIISIYLLFGREKLLAQGKKLCCAFLKPRHVSALSYWLKRSHSIFAGFISGKMVETLVMGVVCYMGMLIFRMEYALLISVIVAVTNIIPFIGAVLGAAIGIMILLMVNPYSAFWFLIFILVLQQLEGNILGPRILGDTLGISSFWVVLAILLGGGLFGVMGMILFIPVFAILYEMIGALTRDRLKKKGLPSQTDVYSHPGLPKALMDRVDQTGPQKERNE